MSDQRDFATNPYAGSYETAGLERAWDEGYDAMRTTLGDEPLYRSMTDDEYDLWRNHGSIHQIHHKNEYMERVWPKEPTSDGL